MGVSIFWFRRDLRLEDNIGLFKATQSSYPVLPIFIFDTEILTQLPEDDARVSFIYDTLQTLNKKLNEIGSGIKIYKGKPSEVWTQILQDFDVKMVYTNKDYEPYAIKRDLEVKKHLEKENIEFHQYKDQVIFEENEVLKNDGKPYTVYTPYKNKWLSIWEDNKPLSVEVAITSENFLAFTEKFPSLKSIGFNKSDIQVKPFTFEFLAEYEAVRNDPAADQTSYLSPHLRFGTVSIRKIALLVASNPVFLSELIWREFFMQILFHFPRVVTNNFKPKYDAIPWRNNEKEFEAWCKGETGYPLVDAGMRQLNETGYMHNRVRMVTASFLCKHLLIDWRWGEAYFASKLLDYELSSNNGNWQWAAGTGCDAAPYFRVFNPITQLKKFDPKHEYTNRWVKNLNEFSYPDPIVEHKLGRTRAIETYKEALN